MECDKFSRKAIRKQLTNWFDTIFYHNHARGVTRLHVDSWECGSQNWNSRFTQEFLQRRGYDLLPWMPVYAGVPLGGSERAEEVLRDIRLTIAELIDEVFFDELEKASREYGVRLSAECVAPTMVSDGLLHYRHTDCPMGEFWLHSPTHDKPNDMADAISGAHIYGKNIIQAEGFTEVRGTWDEKYDFLRMERDKKDIGQELPFRYISYPVGKRLKVSADAADFFGEDGAVGAAASPRRNGIALHGILSSVQIASDLEGTVEDAVLEGTLSPEEGRDALALLSKRIASHPEWFSSRGLNEVTVFDADGTEKRPDRVVIRDGEATIIDYKFGERTPESDARYSGQVSRYMKIFRSLGYTKISGAVWYVVPDKMISL